MNTDPTDPRHDPADPPIHPYLWDPSAEPDADVARLELLLAPLASSRALPSHEISVTRRRLALAAALALLALPGVLLLAWPRASGWRIELASGAARVDGAPASGVLRAGALLETDPGASAALRMPGVGTVLVDSGSRLRVTRAASNEHRLALERGRIVATISAPPRLFFVDTPSAEAIDLGCVYTLMTDEAGVGRLEVAVGFVALKRADREVFVPAGASCPIHASGPGIPRFADAPPELAAFLDAFQPGHGAGPSLASFLDHASVRDTLWMLSLIPLLEGQPRADVIARANELVPIPEADRAGVEQADPDALVSWRLELQARW